MSSSVCCLFCEDASSSIYEINGNSVLIEKDLVDIDELIFNLFMTRVSNSNITHVKFLKSKIQ